VITFPVSKINSYIRVFCTISEGALKGAEFTEYILQEKSPLEYEIIASNELFHYNSNSNISTSYAEAEYTLEYKYRGNKIISSTIWKLQGTEEILTSSKTNPNESML